MTFTVIVNVKDLLIVVMLLSWIIAYTSLLVHIGKDSDIAVNVSIISLIIALGFSAAALVL